MPEPASPEKKPAQAPRRKPIREMILLAEQAAESGIKVVPGSTWGFHYAVPVAERAEKLEGLLAGRYQAADVTAALRPSALVYNAQDIETQGVAAVGARIFELTSYIKNYDHKQFAEFAESMRGHEITPETVEGLYGGLVGARMKKALYDAHGSTGRRQVESAFHQDAARALEMFDSLTREQKILAALKANWLAESMGQFTTDERDRFVSRLSGAERELFKELADPYRQYVTTGDQAAYQQLVKKLADGLPRVAQQAQRGQSESMEELEKELEQVKDEAGPPGSESDPAIPPEDSDEYITPPSFPPSEEGGQESLGEQILFSIEPPLKGHYAGGRKSYYDRATKTWSKKKQLSVYTERTSGGNRHTMSGHLSKGITSLPLPVGYALDAGSIKSKGSTLELSRDQNGCFYVQGQSGTEFSVEFVKEAVPFASPVVPADTQKLFDGALGRETEQVFSKLNGNALHKAEQLRQHLFAHHFYPGGGDLQMAQALQYKLRSESAPEKYISALDSSEYLECYSANTLFVALARRAGIPARLVVGHMIDSAKKGKANITGSTGHAWSEVFDGTTWRRFDATPQAKPEDKEKDDKEKEDVDKGDQGDQAEDGGVDGDQSGEGESGEGGEQGEGQGGQDGEAGEGESGQDGEGESSGEAGDPSGSGMGEAQGGDVQQGEKELAEAREQLEQMKEAKEKLEQQLAEAKDFKDLAKAKEEIEKSDLLEDMKESLEEKSEAQEEQMRDEVSDKIDEMSKDGFMDDERKKELEKLMEEGKLEELDKVREQIERESALYNEYNEIREQVRPLVNKWFKYFYERLPREENVELDEDSLTRQGAFSRRSISRPRNLIFGTVKNPRRLDPSFKPRFLASIMLDVSGSMGGGTKIRDARTLLVFYSELFSRISEEFGYIRFSISTFSDSVTEIKTYSQDYAASKRYRFADGEQKTVKVRLMEKVTPTGGTDMLPAVQRAAAELGQESRKYPDYAAGFYLVGDGEDTSGNADKIREFMGIADGRQGFGPHMRRATMLGTEAQRKVLAGMFGDDHTSVAPDLESLIHESMVGFDHDIKGYLARKVRK